MTSDPIIVGVSGGVDSSVAALQLVRSGRPVAGLFMKNWEEDDNQACPAEADAADAQAVCDLLGITLHTRNFAAEYWDGVFEQFLLEHRAGRTPNPDVLCNREIKFTTFLEHARDLGAERIATGHYARLQRGPDGDWRLLRALDGNKDQSYFLHALNQDQLAASEFPLGDLTKPQVRQLAAEAGLATADKKDSTGICFIGERDFRGFLARYLPEATGTLRSIDGRVLGEHPGSHFFTLGQRQGLGIGGRADGNGQPWFVVGKDPADNIVWVDQGDSPLLYSQTLVAVDIHWIAGQAPAGLQHNGAALSCMAKVRYRQPDQSCTVQALADGRWQVRFEQPQRAVTPGQSVVFYDGDICLGGGIIDRTDAAFGGLEQAA
ncbi:MAG: tRNA 2-thiouridine(34) synthase MnmA [Xanthomonadales bacterium]|nr:tRNA 2-thiouridine(34) synthase MnmA [Xanthomonadales bacterium]